MAPTYYDWKGEKLDPVLFGRYGSFYPVLASKHSLTYDNVRGQVGKIQQNYGSCYDMKPKLVFTVCVSLSNCFFLLKKSMFYCI
jgi:hypothetical protein